MSFGIRFRLYLNFPGKVALVLGICQSILGILNIVLAVAGFVQKIWGHYYASGIWCGLVVFIDGLCGILASQTRTGLGVKTFFVVSALSAVVTFILIILSFGGLDFRSNFYQDAFLYMGQGGQTTKAVHGSLLALGLVEFIVSIISAAMCLKPTCYEKSEWTYTQSKTKPLQPQRSSLYKNPDTSHGFMGGNPDCVPSNDEPMIRRYRSPRRQQNGTGYHRAERELNNEPTETSGFLPRDAEHNHHIDDEVGGRNSIKQKQRSRESDNIHNKLSERGRSSQGRVYGRQSNRRRSEGNERKTGRQPVAESSLDRSTVPRRHNQRPSKCRQTSNEDEYVTARNGREHGLDRNGSWRERELAGYRQPSGLMSYDSWERRNQGRQTDIQREERKVSSAQSAFQQPRRRSGSQEPERSEQTAPEGEVHSYCQKVLPSNSGAENKSFGRRIGDRRRSSLEPTNNYRESVSDNISSTKVKDNSSNGQLQMQVNTQSNASGLSYLDNGSLKRSSISNDRTPMRFSDSQDSARVSTENCSVESRLAPLHRSIGSRGSYSAAVNLMPTELLDNLSNLNTEQTNLDHVPPTAFGEEELPGYEAFGANYSHVYASVDSVVSTRVTNRLMRLEQGTGSAEISVADEEVQEILGTGNNDTQNNTPLVPHTESILNERRDMDARQVNTNESGSRTHGRMEEKRRVGQRPGYTSEQHNNMRASEAISKMTTNLHPTNLDQSTHEASLALPSPMRSSPAFERGKSTRASDRLPQYEPDDVPDIEIHKSFRASFPQRKTDRERNPRRWGISVTEPREQSTSPESLPAPVPSVGEDNALTELSASFPLLSGVGGVDFGMSDRDSYLEAPDSTVYSFSFDEVKPRVFPTSPYRTPRKTSPLTIISVPKMPSSEDEVESRTRVIETVNVGIASPPHKRRNQPKQSSFHDSEKMASRRGDITSSETKRPVSHLKDSVPVKPEQKINNFARAGQPAERQQVETTAVRSKFFYPPERLPSRVGDDTQPMAVKLLDTGRQSLLPSAVQKTGNYEQLSTMTTGGRSVNTQTTGVNLKPPTVPKLGSSRPEDAHVALHAFQHTLSERTTWERQTYPPLFVDQAATPRQQRTTGEIGRTALRRVMRSEQAAQEEPLEQRAHLGDNTGDVRLYSRRYAVPFSSEPSAPSTGGPPPYSEVAPPTSQIPRDRAPHQPHSSGRTSHSPPRTDRPRRQPVFSLVL